MDFSPKELELLEECGFNFDADLKTQLAFVTHNILRKYHTDEAAKRPDKPTPEENERAQIAVSIYQKLKVAQDPVRKRASNNTKASNEENSPKATAFYASWNESKENLRTLSKERFLKEFSEQFFYFRRGDSLDGSGTIFSLKYANSTKTLGKTKLYLYYITDNSIPYCQKRILYTNNSPELIYHIIHNERSSRFFRNIFMDSLRVGDALRTKSGKKRKSNHTFIIEDVDDELEFGNGYIGGIHIHPKKFDYWEPTINSTYVTPGIYKKLYQAKIQRYADDMKKDYLSFDRGNGTKFDLRFMQKVSFSNRRVVHEYVYREGNEERHLFMEISPEDIAEMSFDSMAYMFFTRKFLSQERVREVFAERKLSSYNRKGDLFIGNGYAGYIYDDNTDDDPFTIKTNYSNQRDIIELSREKDSHDDYIHSYI